MGILPLSFPYTKSQGNFSLSYANLIGHRTMIFDDHRNSLYAQALRQIITPDSVVLDLGAGLGIHGLLAASMGAKKVFLVEPHADLQVAAEVAKDNALGDCVECFQGAIEEVQLPQKVDVVISVFTGNFLLEEDLLPSLVFARDHFLKPGGRLLPDYAVMEVAPISIPAQFTKQIEQWSERSQGIDLKILRSYAANNVYRDNYRETEFEFLASPVEICELDFMQVCVVECKQQTRFKVNKNGLCHGFMGWFKARLGDNWLSTSPTALKTHWRQLYLPLDPPLVLKIGEELAFELHRPEFGEWTWRTDHLGQLQKHSTFLSEPISTSMVRKKSGHHKALLNEKGRAASVILELLRGELSTNEISERISNSFPDLFPDNQYAKRFVLQLIDRFT